jgi:hypothetical protein
MEQGGVSSRVALLLRSTEPQPSLLDLSFHWVLLSLLWWRTCLCSIIFGFVFPLYSGIFRCVRIWIRLSIMHWHVLLCALLELSFHWTMWLVCRCLHLWICLSNMWVFVGVYLYCVLVWIGVFGACAQLDLSFRCVLYQFCTEFMLLGGCVHVVTTTSSLDIQKRTIMYCLYKLHTILRWLLAPCCWQFTPRCHHHVVIHLVVDNLHHVVIHPNPLLGL